ncbi:MAG: polymer-forming cytoskeletal protein [Prosthecobacter sp.]|nr:polymer-forming cytoskeletal protein [Prosthecobacter sp.]
MRCPECGAAQYEPRLVVSTFCKKCGVHLSIQRGKVTASTASRAGRVRGSEDWDVPATPNGSSAPAKNGTHPPPDPAKNGGVHIPHAAAEEAELLTTPPSQQEVEEGGFGVFLKQQASAVEDTSTQQAVAESSGDKPPSVAVPSQPEAEPMDAVKEATEAPPPARPLTGTLRRPQSNSPPPTPAPEPMTATTLQRMKEQGIYRNAYFKDADCFDCRHKFKVGRSSRSASCPQCGALISLEDVEINMDSTQPVKTRGDLLIRKRGHLSTDQVHCRDLRCQGTFEANVEASGDALFRTTGKIIGQVRCRRLVVEKGADVTFLNPIHAEEADIQARVTGTIICSGPLAIASGGAVNGDVTARSVAIEPGGELNGAMNIVRSQVPRPGA